MYSRPRGHNHSRTSARRPLTVRGASPCLETAVRRRLAETPPANGPLLSTKYDSITFSSTFKGQAEWQIRRDGANVMRLLAATGERAVIVFRRPGQRSAPAAAIACRDPTGGGPTRALMLFSV